jgi:hypothetical protein
MQKLKLQQHETTAANNMKPALQHAKIEAATNTEQLLQQT